MKPDAAAQPAIGSGAQRRAGGGDAATPWVLVLVLGAVGFGLFNHDFSVNGLRYADDVERGIELFHPNHLLPNLLYRGAWLASQGLGLTGIRAIWLMQAINVCAGLIVAASIARIALPQGGRTRALLVGALYACGFAAWNFAEEPDVYILPAAAVAISLAILLRRTHLDWRAVGALALLAVFAVLTLQQYVFWYPALLALVAVRDLGEQRRAKVMLLAVGVPLACLLAYVAAGMLSGHLHSANDIASWFLGYAWSDHGGFATYRAAPQLPSRLLGALLGLGNLALAYEVILSPVTVFVAAIAGTALLFVVASSARSLAGATIQARRDAVVIALWCAANLAFATWWESRNIEFLFPVWVGAAALAALAAPGLDRRLLALTVVLLGGVNLSAAFWPQHDWPQRYRVADALASHERLGKGDVLITEELNTIGYLHYFAHTDVRFLPGAVSAAMHLSMPIARARAEIDSALASGARVYTTEVDEHGRLREIARWFAPLGRSGFDGAVEHDMATLYKGLDVTRQPVPGARRVVSAGTLR